MVRGTALAAFLVVASSLASCGLFGDKDPVTEVAVIDNISHGACLPSYGSQVLAADMNEAGTRVLYLTEARPATLPEEQSWSQNDRALVVLDINDSGAANERHIATTWTSTASIQRYATEEPEKTAPKPIQLSEQMQSVQMDKMGASFVVAVSRQGGRGVYQALYSGTIPESGTAQLDPEEGLSLIEIVSTSGVEGINDFWFAPEGDKVAALVGDLNELRVYDIKADSNNLTVYSLDKDGEVVVEHSLPEPSTNLDNSRRPAMMNRGHIKATWSPSSDRLAITRGESEVSRSSLLSFDVATGESELIRSYNGSTAPDVAWDDAGQALWVLNTPMRGSGGGTDSVFGNTQVRKIKAEEDGDEIGSGASLARQLGWRSTPGDLAVLSDNESLLYISEQGLYRLDLNAGSLANASSSYMLLRQRVPKDLSVIPGTVVASKASDRVMFLMQDRAGVHVALRNEASAASCSIDDPAVEEDAPAEGEAAPAEEEAPAEGADSEG
jgi:hypothetical protein